MPDPHESHHDVRYKLGKAMGEIVRKCRQKALGAVRLLTGYAGEFGWVSAVIAFSHVRIRDRMSKSGTDLCAPIGTGGTITLRSGTTDIPIYEQIFVQRECEMPFDIQPTLIIDAART